jgi:hypothetical protein
MIVETIKERLTVRPVWESSDLFESIHGEGVTEDMFYMGLSSLLDLPHKTLLIKNGNKYHLSAPQVRQTFIAGTQLKRITVVGGYVLAVPINDDNAPQVFEECYLRTHRPDTVRKMGLRMYVQKTQASSIFSSQISKYLSDESPYTFLVEMDADFHLSLMKSIVLGKDTGMTKLAGDKAAPVYLEFRLLVLRKDVPASIVGKSGSAIVGYVGPQEAHIYGNNCKWTALGKSDVGIALRHRENTIIVGYVEEKEHIVRFKVRPPLDVVNSRASHDARVLSRGAVCSTRPKHEQLETMQLLKIEIQPKESRCDAIRNRLLLKERDARKSVNGVRWFYLFNDVMPILGN